MFIMVRSFMRKIALYLLIMIMVCAESFAQTGKYRTGAFFAHSTGTNIWGQTGSTTTVTNEIVKYNRSHGYTGSDSCKLTKYDFPTNPWTNEWSRWDSSFTVNNDPNANILQYLATNKIIMIKSCFPSSSITGEGSYADTQTVAGRGSKTIYIYKWHWRRIINVMRQHPENFFIIWTGAAQCEYANPIPSWAISQADRAHRFNKWAKDTLAAGLDPISSVFPKNVYVFDFFHKYTSLATSWLNPYPEYAKGLQDAHPNAACTDLVAPQLVQEIFDAAISYESGSSIPSVPSLDKPVNGAQLSWASPRLSWSRCEGALNYHMQVSHDSLFNTLLVNDSSLVDTSKLIGPLANELKYYWRMRSKNSSGVSGWSDRWNFTISVAPSAPGLLLPTNGAENQPNIGWVRWYKSTYATSYHIQISTDSLFGTIVADDSTLSDTLAHVGPLGNSTKYYWRVHSKNSAGTSSWSSPWKFTTSAYTFPYLFKAGWNLLSLPINVLDARTTQLYWNAISSAYAYTVAYTSIDTIQPGIGYWLKFGQDELLGIVGIPVARETVDIAEGWNLIGSIGIPVAIGSIISQPGGIVTSEFYRFENSYVTSDTILPGNGYWVKATQSGKLILSASGQMGSYITIVPTSELPPSPPEAAAQGPDGHPVEYRLSQNYPNPFNPQTSIRYTLPTSGHVRLTVFDLLGRSLMILIDEYQEAGNKSVTFDATVFPSGMYFYRLEAGRFTECKKMILMK
jgi:hypothetical protein